MLNTASLVIAYNRRVWNVSSCSSQSHVILYEKREPLCSDPTIETSHVVTVKLNIKCEIPCHWSLPTIDRFLILTVDALKMASKAKSLDLPTCSPKRLYFYYF